MTIAIIENKNQLRRIRKKYPGIWNEEICHVSEESINDQCCICRREYSEENPRILYDCQHSSHLQCILEFQEKRTCSGRDSCEMISSKLACPICDKRINWKRAKLLTSKKNIKLYVNHTMESAKKKIHGGVKKHMFSLKKTLSLPDLNKPRNTPPRLHPGNHNNSSRTLTRAASF
mmetsp:Transcript_1740/g.6112  ORF Transcript_1740/g.6112 Transcript_1740/m.6112 type:complete len:175 (+) Transcript_1740:200-724(+)